MSKEFELKPIEKNIPVSKIAVHSKSEKTLAIEERLLSTTPKADSFIVEEEHQAHTIRTIGKKMGRLVITRKMYVQEDVKNQRLSDLKPVFRIWVKEITKPQGGVQGLDNKPKNPNVDKYSVPQSVLQIAELKAENRMIVEDIEKIKKIIIEELGTKNEFKYPLRTNEDQGDLG